MRDNAWWYWGNTRYWGNAPGATSIGDTSDNTGAVTYYVYTRFTAAVADRVIDDYLRSASEAVLRHLIRGAVLHDLGLLIRRDQGSAEMTAAETYMACVMELVARGLDPDDAD